MMYFRIQYLINEIITSSTKSLSNLMNSLNKISVTGIFCEEAGHRYLQE
jgi:hypothetical protein